MIVKVKTKEDLFKALSDPWWRINNLYCIVIKDEEEDENDEEKQTLVIKFKMNEAQDSLFKNLWYRNIVPKARQRGITTAACIYALDCALFSNNIRCDIIAHRLDDAKKFMRNKIMFAYDRLPDQIKNTVKVTTRNAEEVIFSNGSSIGVSTSARSGTPHFLHISEYAKICAESPIKAEEIVTGSFPAVPKKGIIIIESTSRGVEGDFYDKAMRAKQHRDGNKKLTIRDYRLHFFSWWDADEYAMEPEGVIITDDDHQYFDKLENIIGRKLSIEKRAWYCATRDEDFGGSEQRMWQEYPSTVEEAFKVSIKGAYFAEALEKARKEGRIRELATETGILVDTYWDLGKDDTNVIWFCQRAAGQYRFINYYENNGYGPDHYARELKTIAEKNGYIYGSHYMPHDVAVRDYSLTANKTRQDVFEELGVKPISRVDRTTDLIQAIDMTRIFLSKCWFDEAKCKLGLKWLSLYKKEWDEKRGCYRDHPAKGPANHAADGLRQASQSDGIEVDTSALKRRRRTRSARMA